MREFTLAQQVRRSIRKTYLKTLWNPFVHALQTYDLLQEGDNVAVCVSGGKDSFLTAVLFSMLHEHSDFPFGLQFLCMDPGYTPEDRQSIVANAARLAIPLKFFNSSIYDYVATQSGSPCYLCARMRRGHLYKEAQGQGCNKIALGHHFNDVIETTLMSMLYGAQIQSMPPRLHAKNFAGMQLIRPLYAVHEASIRAWQARHALKFMRCGCRFTEHCNAVEPQPGAHLAGKRSEIKALIEQLKQTHPDIEKCIFKSTHNVRLSTLPGTMESANPKNSQ